MVDLLDLPFDDKLPSLPCLAAPGPMGVVFTQYYSPIDPAFRSSMSLNKRYGLVGASYMAVYEFGPKIRGASALNFGQSGDPKSPHYFDQAQLLSERKLKPELFDWPDVLAGANRSTIRASRRSSTWPSSRSVFRTKFGGRAGCPGAQIVLEIAQPWLAHAQVAFDFAAAPVDAENLLSSAGGRSFLAQFLGVVVESPGPRSQGAQPPAAVSTPPRRSRHS